MFVNSGTVGNTHLRQQSTCNNLHMGTSSNNQSRFAREAAELVGTQIADTKTSSMVKVDTEDKVTAEGVSSAFQAKDPVNSDISPHDIAAAISA